MSGIDWKALQANFAADELEFRIQQAGEKNGRVWALCVPYVTNRAIQNRLDAVVGPENWKNEFHPGPQGGVVCGLSIRVPRENGAHEWVTKWDGAENTDIEGVKGGLSGAMKRAAVEWGLGRILYELDEMFAKVGENGRYRGKTKDNKPFRWDAPELPAWALPDAGADSEWAAAAKRLEVLSREVDVLRQQAGETDEGPDAAEQWAAQIINSALGDLTALEKAVRRMEQRHEKLMETLESTGT